MLSTATESIRNNKLNLDRPSRSSRLAQPGMLTEIGPALMYLHFEAKRMNFFSPRIKIGV